MIVIIGGWRLDYLVPGLRLAQPTKTSAVPERSRRHDLIIC